MAASVAALLDRFERYADESPAAGRASSTPGVQLAIAAAIVARTPDVPLPEIGDEVDLGEREEGAA